MTDMSGKIQLRIVTPDGERFSALVDYVCMQSPTGSFGIQPNHAPMLSVVVSGEISYGDEHVRHSIPTIGGVAEIRNTCVTILE